jgi:hypothetical protein
MVISIDFALPVMISLIDLRDRFDNSRSRLRTPASRV